MNMNKKTSKLIRKFILSLGATKGSPEFTAAYRKAKKQYLSAPKNLRRAVKDSMSV